MATITICDLCGSRKSVKSRSYPFDRVPDAAGGMEDQCEIYDLCPECECKVLNAVIHKRISKTEQFSLNRDIIDNIKRRLKENSIQDV